MHWFSETCSPAEGNYKGAGSQGSGAIGAAKGGTRTTAPG
uniref:Uncharacterized protein n=1 Tax=Manihot esculenta TaxID=3983 RepID=A0A2C9VJQ8_MANES